MTPENSVSSIRRMSFETAGIFVFAATLVIALIVLIPSNSVPFLYTKAAVLALGGLIALALYILERLSHGNIILPPLVLPAALWLVPLAYGLSVLFSGAHSSSAIFGTALEPDTLGFILIAAGLGTLAALLPRRAAHYRIFITALGWGAGLIALIQIVLLVIGQFMPGSVSPGISVLGSFADLGRLMGLVVVGVLLALRLLVLSSRLRTMLLVLGAFALVFIVLAASSLTWVLLALVSLGLFVEAVMRHGPGSSDDLSDVSVLVEPETQSASTRRPLVPPLIVLIVALFFFIGGSIGQALATAFQVNVLDVRPSWQSTILVGENVYKTSPFFGSGPGSFGATWLKFRDASLNQTPFWNIDFTSGVGFVPTSLVTTGMLGVLAWLAFFALFLFIGFRALILRAPEDGFIRFIAISSFVATIYLFTLAVFAVPTALLVALGFVFAGLFASTLRFTKGGRQWGVVFAKSPRTGFVIVFGLTLLLLASVAAGYLVIEQYLAQVYLLEAQSALAAGNSAGALAAGQSSISFAPSAQAYQLEALAEQRHLGQIISSTTLAPADAQRQFQDALAGGINAALTATRLAPQDYRNWLTLGNLYAGVVSLQIPGAYQNAITSYVKAANLNPTAPAIPYLQAQLEIANKNNGNAELLLKQAIALKGDYTAAIFLLSQVEVARGNIKDALTAAEAAVYFSPANPTLLFQVGILRAATGNLSGAITALSGAVAANPQYANARYFLAVAYAETKDYHNALAQLNAIAALSDANKRAVAPDITALGAGKNPFPASLLSAPVPAQISGQ